MKLSRLRLRRAPGLDKGLGELRFEAGLNVVFGPNESGKSTLARAIQSTLWPVGRKPGSVIDGESEWSEGDRFWSARYDGDTTWSRDGEVVTACQQTCPTGAITFGNWRDADGQIHKLIADNPRNYNVLQVLNTRPAVTYLAQVMRDDQEGQH